MQISGINGRLWYDGGASRLPASAREPQPEEGRMARAKGEIVRGPDASRVPETLEHLRDDPRRAAGPEPAGRDARHAIAAYQELAQDAERDYVSSILGIDLYA